MSQLNYDTWKDRTGTREYFKCQAWVNFNGTGTVAIRASGNVSSITDNGTGDYTINLTNAMSDTNYGFVVTSNADRAALGSTPTIAAGSLRFQFDRTTDLVRQDGSYVSVYINR